VFLADLESTWGYSENKFPLRSTNPSQDDYRMTTGSVQVL
jgi:hypothetical protein